MDAVNLSRKSLVLLGSSWIMNTVVRRSSRIDAVPGAVGAAPAPGAHRLHAAGAVTIVGLEAEAEADWRLAAQLADLVGGHELHGVRREDAHLAERAAIAQRLEEGRIVARRRNQSRAAGKLLRGPST